VGVTAAAIVFFASITAADVTSSADSVTVSVLAVQASNEHRDSVNEGTAARRAPGKKPVSEQLRQGFIPSDNGKPKQQRPGAIKKSHFDPGLDEIREAVASFPYDTYRKVSSETASIQRDKEKTFSVNETYTLRLTPLKEDEEGRLRIRVRIDEKTIRGGKPVTINALDTTSAIAPGKHLMLGGLPLPEGKLIVFISLRP